MANATGFDWHGDDPPASPVVVSVPHAGRDYPLALRAALKVPLEQLRPLEDRLVDLLAHAAVTTQTLIVQRRPRAWIDLNRAEQERDPRIDAGAVSRALPLLSPKLRSGLGLVPRRAGGSADIWRRRFDGAEIDARILADHRPYHAALARALAAARARFGAAVLLDVHSMPSLGTGQPRIVLGDRFGRSAAARFVHRLEAEADGERLPTALNTPYAGGHVLDRHGQPMAGMHALQIEFDRSLYLDAALDQPGAGFDAAARLLRAMIAAAEDEALARPALMAAE